VGRVAAALSSRPRLVAEDSNLRTALNPASLRSVLAAHESRCPVQATDPGPAPSSIFFLSTQPRCPSLSECPELPTTTVSRLPPLRFQSSP